MTVRMHEKGYILATVGDIRGRVRRADLDQYADDVEVHVYPRGRHIVIYRDGERIQLAEPLTLKQGFALKIAAQIDTLPASDLG